MTFIRRFRVVVPTLLIAACGRPAHDDAHVAGTISSGVERPSDPKPDLAAAAEPAALETTSSPAVMTRKPTNPAFDDLDPSTIEIRLDRTRCFGWCPDYAVRIDGDGKVFYTGRSFVLAVGEREGLVSRESVRNLVGLCRLERFFDLDMECHVMVTDVPSTTLRLTLGDRTREVTNRWAGSGSDMFPEENAHIPVHQALDGIADAIDRAVNIEQWIGSESEREHRFRNSRDGLLPSGDTQSEARCGSARTTDPTPPQNEEQERVARLADEAKRLAGNGPVSEGEALAAFSKAEDEAAKCLDRAVHGNDETASTFFVAQYRQILNDSDAFVTSLFTPERVEATPWVDLLAPNQEKHWQHYGVEQFRIEEGCLQLLGPRAGASERGLIVFPDTGGFRDFELELEFTLKGTIDWVFRLGRRLDNTIESWNVSTAGPEPLTEGRLYSLHATMIGSRLTGRLVPEDTVLPETTSSWIKSRKGGLGAQIHEGAELKITRFRVRRLRDA